MGGRFYTPYFPVFNTTDWDTSSNIYLGNYKTTMTNTVNKQSKRQKKQNKKILYTPMRKHLQQKKPHRKKIN